MPTSSPPGALSRRLFSALVLGTTATLATGCADSDSGEEPSPVTSGPGGAGALTVAVPADAASMDPMLTHAFGAVDGNRLTAVYDVLVWSDPATGTVQPQIADSLTAHEDGKTWTLRLRGDIMFTDGTPFDAEAVRFNWERHRDTTNHSLQLAATADIAALQVTDPLTLQVRLRRSNANFDRIVARHLSHIVSPTAIRKDPVGIDRRPVGAGPYQLAEWAQDGRQVFVRNPGYWQTSQGLPRFETVTMSVDGDAVHAADEIAAEHLHAAVVFAPEAIVRATYLRLGVRRTQLDGGAMLVFNTAATPFNDVRVRRAVAAALSAAEVNTRFHKAAGTAAQGIFARTSPVANPQLVMTDDDPGQAKALFAQVTGNGARPLRFVMVVPQASSAVRIAEYVRDTINAYAGVEAQIQVAGSTDFIRTVRKGEWTWGAALTQQWFSDPEPGLYDFLHSTSSTNLSGYSNPAVDKALDEARQNTDQSTRRTSYAKVQVELNRDVPFWVYLESVAAAVFDSRIRNVQLCNDGIVLWDRIDRA